MTAVGVAVAFALPAVFESTAVVEAKASQGAPAPGLAAVGLAVASDPAVLDRLGRFAGPEDDSKAHAVEAAKRGLGVVQEPGGRLRVSFQSPHPEDAQRGCETLATAVLRALASPALDDAAKKQRAILEEKTQALAVFVSTHPDVVGEQPAQPGPTAAGAHPKATDAGSDPTLVVLRQERKRLETELAARAAPAPSSVFGPNPYDEPPGAEDHALERRLSELRLAIFAHQKAMEAKAASTTAKQEASVVATPALLAEWRKLVQDVVDAQKGVSAESPPAVETRLAEPATLPRFPVKPNRLAVSLIGALAGLWAAVVAVLLLSRRVVKLPARVARSMRVDATVQVPALPAPDAPPKTATQALPAARTARSDPPVPGPAEPARQGTSPVPAAAPGGVDPTRTPSAAAALKPRPTVDVSPGARSPSHAGLRGGMSTTVVGVGPVVDRPPGKSDPPRPAMKSEPPRPTAKSDPPLPAMKSVPPRPNPRSDPPRARISSNPPPGASQPTAPRDALRPPQAPTEPARPAETPWQPRARQDSRPSQAPGPPRRTISPPPMAAPVLDTRGEESPDTRRIGSPEQHGLRSSSMPYSPTPGQDKLDTTYSIVDRSRRPPSKRPEQPAPNRRLSDRGTRPLMTDAQVMQPPRTDPPRAVEGTVEPGRPLRSGTRPGWAIPSSPPGDARGGSDRPRARDASVARSEDAIRPRSVPPSWRPPPPEPAPGAEIAQLRDQILSQCTDRCFVVGITSDAETMGAKTVLATRLAWLLAESAKRVLIMEANFDFPAVHRVLGVDMPRHSGFSQQIHARIRGGERSPWTVIRCTPNLHALAEGFMRSPGVSFSREFADAVTELRQSYDVIIADGPTASAGADCRPLNALADGLVVAVRPGGKLSDAIDQAAQWFSRKELMAAVFVAAT